MPTGTGTAVSPDGRWTAGYITNKDISSQVWDSRTGKLAATIDAHSDYVASLTFSPDSKQILTASWDKTVRIHTINC
jgi:WD40 repeat protein